MNQRIWMPYLRQEGVQNIAGFYFQAGCINAGMAADKGMAGNNILINKQFYPVFGVVHQSQDTDGTGGDIQKPFHILFFSKGKAGTADLFGKLRRMKLFLPRHQQKVEGGFLGIA